MKSDKPQLFSEYLKEKVEIINRAEFHPSKFEILYKLKRDIIADAIIHGKQNLEYYLKFADIVKNESYFRVHHIDRLKLPYDILIFVSEKNIGKSRQMLAAMDDAYDRGKQFVIMRALDNHITLGLNQQLYEDHSNFYLYPSNGKIYSKETKKPAGHAMSLNTCIK